MSGQVSAPQYGETSVASRAVVYSKAVSRGTALDALTQDLGFGPMTITGAIYMHPYDAVGMNEPPGSIARLQKVLDYMLDEHIKMFDGLQARAMRETEA